MEGEKDKGNLKEKGGKHKGGRKINERKKERKSK